MPDVRGGTALRKAVGVIVNDWQLAGIWTAATGSAYAVGYSYNNGGGNVNLTGSPDYGGRIRIVGDTGNGCSDDVYRQFNAAAFQGPLPGSRRPRVREQLPEGLLPERARPVASAHHQPRRRPGHSAARRRLQRLQRGADHRPQHDRQLRQSERSGDRDQPAVRRQRKPGGGPVAAARRRLRRRERLPDPAAGAGADPLQVLARLRLRPSSPTLSLRASAACHAEEAEPRRRANNAGHAEGRARRGADDAPAFGRGEVRSEIWNTNTREFPGCLCSRFHSPPPARSAAPSALSSACLRASASLR